MTTTQGSPVYFKENGISVSATRIVDSNRKRQIEMEYVRSVRAGGYVLFGMVVDVWDLTNKKRRFKLKNRQSAMRFIAAIRKANPSVTVKEDDGFFVFWWS